jgi:hypothetical protein
LGPPFVGVIFTTFPLRLTFSPITELKRRAGMRHKGSQDANLPNAQGAKAPKNRLRAKARIDKVAPH